ncbi:MAG: hypothetical protein K0R38_5118 [Polyangiaceae bacterium]|nr:hypothetical protein [Polyangiaceae bacterium]
MKRFGPAVFWSGVGLSLVSGCGGRTGDLDDLYADDGDGSVSGMSSGGGRAGSTGKGGLSSVAGTRTMGGSAPVAGRGGSGTGAVGGGFGGTGIAGAPVGGVGAFGGTPAGGGPSGGFAGFGAVGGVSPFDCQTCLTQACSPEVAECFQDFGCVAIFGCVVSTGCSTLDCYRPVFCKSIIDQAGGPAGASMKQVLEVVSCAVNSGCPCQ